MYLFKIPEREEKGNQAEIVFEKIVGNFFRTDKRDWPTELRSPINPKQGDLLIDWLILVNTAHFTVTNT